MTPFGNIVAVAARGTLMGNRGCLHDDNGHIRREFSGQRWILCRLSFGGRQRKIMTPGRYTELFFLDEATGLAAGHRPCAECQRERFIAFREAFCRGNPHAFQGKPLGAEDIDRLLATERRLTNPLAFANLPLDDLPDGTMILCTEEDRPFLVLANRLLPWRAEGYAPAITRPKGETVRVLTPRSTVNAIRAGFAVGVHLTAML